MAPEAEAPTTPHFGTGKLACSLLPLPAEKQALKDILPEIYVRRGLYYSLLLRNLDMPSGMGSHITLCAARHVGKGRRVLYSVMYTVVLQYS